MLPGIYICIFVSFIVECMCISHYIYIYKKKMVIKEPFDRQQPRYFDDFIVKEGFVSRKKKLTLS